MKIIQTLLLALAFSSQVIAQQAPNLYSIPTPWERYSHYSITLRGGAGLPIGPMAENYIDKVSMDNYSVAVDWILQQPFSVGVEVSQSFFSKKLPRAIYNIEDQDVSAVQTRTLKQIPVQGVASYYFGTPNARIRPYVQLAAGASFVDYTLYYGNLATQEQAIKFTYGAAAGSRFLFKKDGSVGADLRVKYNQTPFDFDYLDRGIGQINATIGLFYRWW
ncbi:porin family protein [Arundinibacter roseus]|uniref:Outer membrane protein beta-barrel domain-containing protein n=1 Tax=Arundinibacter roseus TaxID=2070510 RepID=A0A4R4KJJ7_9BACT|nr:OmpW family outer membrane protein [Arundinibacter roseus]TDB67082.1 hypothetical protein EZE20_08185 [Arundinibacter roseus]